jgi:ATP-dependent DNA helicase RecG
VVKLIFIKINFKLQIPNIFSQLKKKMILRKLWPNILRLPEYRLKLSKKIYNEEIKKLSEIDEWHDKDFIKKLNWPTWYESIFRLHNPENLSDIDKESKFYKRLAYDEIFSNFLIFSEIKKRIKKLQKKPKTINNIILTNIKKKLSFQLTQGQEKVLDEIFNDLSSVKKMLRVLQGDVGSGKTVVTMLAAATVVKSGYQVAFLCPTDLLAKQHYKLFKTILADENINISLLSGKTKLSEQQKVRSQIESSNIDIAIGTHSLFQEKTIFNNLGLIVIDEQHKFGVQQRINLSLKGNINTDVLLMTATPIPRTLILTTYGEMDISTIKEKPFRNTNILTLSKSLDKIDEIMKFVENKLYEGDQIYWVCPLIEDSEKLTKLSSAVTRFNFLKKKLKYNIGLIHGSLSNEEKDLEMKKFVDGKTKLIVSTTVIEVGIDNPNANTIIIENSERFGLSQLHQLRGRVGRGTKDGSCLLLYASNIGENGRKRIQILKSSMDGFYISEEDLKLRGFGDIIGYKQSGEKDFLIADPAYHNDLFELAKHQIETEQTKEIEIEKRYNKLLKIFKKDKILNIIDTG